MKVRRAEREELEDCFLMGYDTWGADLPMDMYVESCEASYKYKLGTFYVLEDHDGKLLSSCIVYPLGAFGGVVSERAVGIGSLVTAPDERHRGYATLLMSMLMGLLEQEGVDAFFVHSDIHPKIYEALGFSAAPDAVRKKTDGTVPMLRLTGGRPVSKELWTNLVLPSYF